MKKMILGVTLFVSGLFGAIVLIFSTVISPLNPWSYNGIEGWFGVVLGMQLQFPLIVCIAVAIIGLIVSIADVSRTK